MYTIIRAGGSGTRLWPLSRRAKPKQFLPLTDEQSLIEKTFGRLASFIAAENIFISTNEALLPVLEKTLPAFPRERIVIEPSARNTGPAICLEVCFLLDKLGPEAIVASLPSDDYISDVQAFERVLKASADFISENPDYIVTPAVKPEYPETGYSYLRSGQVLAETGQETMYAVGEIIEKPVHERCKALIESREYYWHTGMYVWRLGTAARLFETYQPEMFGVCRAVIAGDPEAGARYDRLEKISVESAITDRADKLAMCVSDALGWSDVGKWPAVKRLSENDGQRNVLTGKSLAYKSEGNLVISQNQKKLIVLNNVKNLAVIETEDVLLISDIDATEDIKKIIDDIETHYI